jgi:hypothetical protein
MLCFNQYLVETKPNDGLIQAWYPEPSAFLFSTLLSEILQESSSDRLNTTDALLRSM